MKFIGLLALKRQRRICRFDDPIGEHDVFAAARRRNELKAAHNCDTQRLLVIAEKMVRIPKEDICSRGKRSGLVDAKEVLKLTGQRVGASFAEMSDMPGINASTVGRRFAKRRIADDDRMSTQ